MLQFVSSYPRLRYMLTILLIAGAYFILARLGLLLQFQSSNATPVWPPSGFAFAVILLLGYRVAPGIMLGALVANIFVFLSNKACDLPTAIWLSFVISIGNTMEALVGYYLFKKMIPKAGLKNFFLKVNHLFRFSLTTVLMCIVGCTIGATAVLLARVVMPNQYLIVWSTWWLGDVSGILLVTPFILIWTKSFEVPSKIFTASWKRKAEAAALFLTVILGSGFIFDNWFFSLSIFKWAFWIIPVLVWAAVRFNQRETVTAIALCSAIAIWGTVDRRGPFAVLSLNESLLAVQAFVSIMVITKLALNASVYERRQTEAMLRDLNNQLELRVQERTSELVHSANQLTKKNEELQQQKEFVETVFDSVEDLMAVFDTQGNYIAVNKKIEEVYNVKKTALIGKNILEFFPKVEESELYKDLQQAMKGETIHNLSYRSVITNRYLENFYIPLKNNNQEIYGILVIGHDNTAMIEASEKIKQSNLLLEQKNRQLEKMNQELESFTHIASHDLQEPLRKIQMFVKLLFEMEIEILSEKGKDYFNRIKSAAQRMQQLIEDLLAYSHATTTQEYFQKTDLNFLLEQVKTELKEKITETNTIIETTQLPELPVIPFQFKQLFTNIISNSIKFSKPDTSPVINIKSTIVDGATIKELKGATEKNYYHFTITDNGIGFQSDLNEKIFGLFQRVHARKEYPGSGIGLSICKKIVENHQGIITANGEPQRGATLNIYLPVNINSI
jgi:PAS domain S-box-containing protein